MSNTDIIRNPYQLRALMEEAAKLDGTAEMYQFIPGHDPESMVYTYVVAFALRWAQQNSKTITVLTNPEQARIFCKARDVDPAQAERVLHQREAQGRGEDPILIANWHNGTHVVFDGTHRLIGHGMRGERTLNAYLIEQDFLERRGFCRLMSRKLHDQIVELERDGQFFH